MKTLITRNNPKSIRDINLQGITELSYKKIKEHYYACVKFINKKCMAVMLQ